jgi:hypothetical protein
MIRAMLNDRKISLTSDHEMALFFGSGRQQILGSGVPIGSSSGCSVPRIRRTVAAAMPRGRTSPTRAAARVSGRVR